jgi:hypothetical protein
MNRRLCLFSTSCTAVMRRHISRAEKQQIVVMSANMTPINIARVTGISR